MNSQRPSGKFVLRLPTELHRQLRREAHDSQKSLNQVCVEKLSAEAKGENLLLQALKEFLGPDLVAVYQYGSSVRGESTPDSDIDILCVVGPKQKIHRSLYRRWDEVQESMNLDSRLSIQFVRALSDLEGASSLWLEVALEGVPLHDPEFSVMQELLKLRKLILQKDYRRTLVHGQPVWIKSKEAQNA